MWQRFTERARRIILFGQEEAGKMSSGHVGTEHLLLGLVREDEGVAAQVLQKMGISLRQVRQEIENEMPRDVRDLPDEPKLTAKAKRVLELAADEARRMRHNYIGTEHLLLALLHEEDGPAAMVLQRLGLNLEKARPEFMEYLGPDDPHAPEEDEVIDRASANEASLISRIIGDLDFAPEVLMLLLQAKADLITAGETHLTVRHLLLAMVENPKDESAQLLQSIGVDLEKARASLREPQQGE
jgi:ATP-dependent Clp protease ATP-binding subunit ClpA